GGQYQVEIKFRDLWEVMKRWVWDETPVLVSPWFSQERFLCLNGKIDLSNQLYDELCTGTTWYKINDVLPANRKYPSCYLGGRLWLDKGLVSTKVKMHLILLHMLTFLKPAAWCEIDPKTLKGICRAEYTGLKRKIYHTMSRVILASLRSQSHNGEALRFGDSVTRVAYPGFLIESMNFEEVAAWLTIPNLRSNHPCLKCLVHHNDLHKLSERFDLHISDFM
ncbi:hypothetical protein C8R45DRAFT_843636, partial [Mycena sanguinolenta]